MFQGLVELLKELKELEIGVEEIRLNLHFFDQRKCFSFNLVHSLQF